MLGIASRYCDEREVSTDYRRALHRVATSMATSGITPSTVQDSSFNEWLGSLRGSATTRSNYRRMALTLWRAAIDSGLTTHCIGRVKKIKAPLPPPVAWSGNEIGQLLDHIDTMRGEFLSGCKHRPYWRAWVLLGYESGLRFGDLHQLRCSSVRGSRLTVLQHKTKQPIAKRLSPECVDALHQLVPLSPDGTIFKWALSRRWVIVLFKGVCAAAGLEGSTKWLRRSGATAVEMVSPGSAQRFLGHLSPGLAQKHYIDQSLLADRCPCPPPISQSRTQDRELASAS